MRAKNFNIRLGDIRSHAVLLSEACDRFANSHKFDEVKNIGVRLRVLVGTGQGSGILFSLAKETRDCFSVVALNQFCVLRISEIENGTGKTIQEVEKKALLTQMPGRLPIVLSPFTEHSLYRQVDFQEWIENGFLLDWDVPQANGSAVVKRFTPQALINRYAGQEAAHADATHGTFGGPIESLTMQYVIRGETLIVPIVYEYLYQIGRTVAQVALDYADKHKDA